MYSVEIQKNSLAKYSEIKRDEKRALLRIITESSWCYFAFENGVTNDVSRAYRS